MKNIRDKFIISIIDNNGVKQFNIHRFVKKVLLYFVGFFVLVSIVLFFTIRLLADELKTMQNRKDDTIEKYVEVYNENTALKYEVNKSQEQLDEINQKIVELEDVISMKNAIVEAKENNPFDIATLNIKQKEMILRILPNAMPFSKEVESTPNIQKIGVLFSLPKSIPIIATADGMVDLTRSDDTKGIGRFVKIVHTFGFNSIYGHLSKVSVKRGDVVKKGQIIGYSGKHNGKDSLYYDIRFLGSEVNMDNFLSWGIENFDGIINSEGIVNWNSLLWTFNDMMQISSHKVLSQDFTPQQIPSQSKGKAKKAKDD